MRDGTKPKRALIATRVHLPEPTAASQRWDAVERALLKAGFEVEVLTSVDPRRAGEGEDTATVSRWPVLRDAEGNLRGYLPYLSFDIPLFFRLLFAPRPDVVMVEPPPTTGLAARAACTLRGLPYIWYAADTWSSGARSMGAPELVARMLELAEKTAIQGADAVIAVTEGVEQRVKEMGGRNVALVPNGIDTDLYVATGERETSLLPDLVQPYFVYAGTASEFQEATMFLDAFQELLEDDRDVQLLFVGGGSDWKEIRRRAEEINEQYPSVRPRVITQDSVPPEEVTPLLSNALASLVSISPRHNLDGAYPTKILASLACGTPVIFMGGGKANRDINENSLGIAADYGTKVAANAMRQMLDDPEAWDPQAMRAWVKANRSKAQTGKGVVKVVDNVIGRRGLPTLLMATRVFVPDSGAAAARLKSLTRRLAPSFRKITVLTSKSPNPIDVEFPENVDVKRAFVFRATDGAVRGYLPYLSFDIPLFFRILAKPRHDVILCEPPPTTGTVVRMSSWLKRTPYVYYAGDLLGDATVASKISPLVVTGVRMIERFALRGAAKVIAVNQAISQKIKNAVGVDAQVVEPGVEIPPAALVQIKPERWPEGAAPVFVYAGTVTDWMGAEIFVAAAPKLFAAFPDARIVFVGGGMGWDSLTRSVDELGDDRVQVIRSVTLEEANRWQAAATACLSSLTRGPYDLAYTTKALSSWSVGTPVVYAGVGPTREDIEQYDLGVAVDHDLDAVAEAMIRMAQIMKETPGRYQKTRLKNWVIEHHGARPWASDVRRVLAESAQKKRQPTLESA